MYENILDEMRKHIEAKEKHYIEWRRQRREELIETAREADKLLDRRRNRKARMMQQQQQENG